MTKAEKLDKLRLIVADLHSRKNMMNRKYLIANIGLDNLVAAERKGLFYLEGLRMKADIADKLIGEAEAQGKATSDPTVLTEIGERINAMGSVLSRSDSVGTAIFVSLQMMAYYGIAVGIWGLALKLGFIRLFIFGAIAGLLTSLILIAPVVAGQRTSLRIRDVTFGAGAIWGNLAIIVGALGLVTWVVIAVIR